MASEVLTREQVAALAEEPEQAVLMVSPQFLAQIMGQALVDEDGTVSRLIAVHRSPDGWLDATVARTGERAVVMGR